MKKIMEKWYLGMFIIPIILTYLTNYITLPEILNNWKNSIIFSLVILIIILIYELFNRSTEISTLKEKPIESDKKTISKLIEILDLDAFHEDLYEQNAWYGYSQSVIRKTNNFVNDVRLIKNKISNPKLNELLNDFTNELEKFHKYSSLRLYESNDYYKPNKDTEKAKKIAEVETNKMNEMTKECFNKLEKLMSYLKRKNYL